MELIFQLEMMAPCHILLDNGKHHFDTDETKQDFLRVFRLFLIQRTLKTRWATSHLRVKVDYECIARALLLRSHPVNRVCYGQSGHQLREWLLLLLLCTISRRG